ncbi:hypothetical protein CGCSCA1_v011953 [Colletotrichum siamense]|nr:hypothetical protein CGCSCA1_v011953 [Colletotrichum siamense]
MRLRLYKFPPMCEDCTTGNPSSFKNGVAQTLTGSNNSSPFPHKFVFRTVARSRLADCFPNTSSSPIGTVADGKL